MSQGIDLGDDERALLSCLPQDGRPVSNHEARNRLGWDERRYLSARARLEELRDVRVGGMPGAVGFIRLNLTPRVARVPLGEDEEEFLSCLPHDGSPVESAAIDSRLGWDEERYAGACAKLEERGYLAKRLGRGETLGRNLAAVPPEFRTACGRPGSHVRVRHAPVIVPHALCDLTGVRLTYPGRGGCIVPQPGCGTGNSMGLIVSVDGDTLDVTVEVRGVAGNR